MPFMFSGRFEETVVNVINTASPSDLVCLARLIKLTRITFNHDKIMAAWITRTRFHNVIDMEVTDHIVMQKLNVEVQEDAASSLEHRGM